MSRAKKIVAIMMTLLAGIFTLSDDVFAQALTKKTAATKTAGYDTSLYRALKWRSIGPFRGGRSTTVAGVPNQPLVYYFGGTGGGVWKTEDGGVFRSDDAGKTWRRVNEDRRLRQRAWYYTHIYADTQDPETVYVLNVQFLKSVDGGKTYENIRVPHGDNHDLWIAPENNMRMVSANDGGACVTFTGGKAWTNEDNQPTAQFYHVITDNRFPYYVYGAQQDNSTVAIASRNNGFGISTRDWYAVGGGESGYIAPHPVNPNIVYAGSYGGYLTRYDHSTGEERNIMPWPENPMGAGAADLT